MGYTNTKKHLHETTFSSAVKGIAEPRLAASVQKGIRENSYGHAKFRIGVMLHNRNTKEDGLVTTVYQPGECGEIMYEMAVPILPGTWAGRHYVSDWAESVLALSDNAILKSDQSPLLPQ
jgi:hypothetical protein